MCAHSEHCGRTTTNYQLTPPRAALLDLRAHTFTSMARLNSDRFSLAIADAVKELKHHSLTAYILTTLGSDEAGDQSACDTSFISCTAENSAVDLP